MFICEFKDDLKSIKAFFEHSTIKFNQLLSLCNSWWLAHPQNVNVHGDVKIFRLSHSFTIARKCINLKRINALTWQCYTCYLSILIICCWCPRIFGKRSWHEKSQECIGTVFIDSLWDILNFRLPFKKGCKCSTKLTNKMEA